MGETTTTCYLQHKKHEMRRVALKRREKIAASANKQYMADNLMTQFFASCILQPNMPVAAYWPFRNEIDVTPLLDRINSMGCDCLLPVIVGHKKPLQFRQWKPDDTLEVSWFGNFEPPRLNPILVPKILVIPLLAFDSAGYRLGYGGGYYDRTLATLRNRVGILAVGAAYEAQKVDSVPHSQFDQRLDAVVTENGFFRTGHG